MVLAGLFLILGVKEYLFRLYALLPAGLPAGRLRSKLPSGKRSAAGLGMVVLGEALAPMLPMR